MNQTNDALKEDGTMKTLMSAFTGYQGKVLVYGPKFTKHVVIQELLNEYRYVQVYFHNMSFHFSKTRNLVLMRFIRSSMRALHSHGAVVYLLLYTFRPSPVHAKQCPVLSNIS